MSERLIDEQNMLGRSVLLKNWLSSAAIEIQTAFESNPFLFVCIFTKAETLGRWPYVTRMATPN